MSRFKNIRKLDGDRVQTRSQDNTANALTPILGSVLIDGILLRNVLLSAGSNFVPHLLGRPLQGWLLVRKRENEQVWDDQDNNVNVSTTLKLQASGSIAVDLWVF